MPLTPRPSGRHSLVVKYVIISGPGGWQRGVWLREPGAGREPEVYRSAVDGPPGRHEPGAPALVRATAQPGAALPTQDIVRTFELLAATATRTLPPVDEGAQDPSFAEFRRRLLSAIERRDVAFLRSVLAPEVEFSFGAAPDREGFVRRWKLDDGGGGIWQELGEALRLGGTFSGGGASPRTFTAPYVFGRLTRADEGAILRAGVPVRARPSAGAAVVANLLYDVVTIVGWTAPAAARERRWAHVRLADGTRGWVHGPDIRSPLDYRAIFQMIDGSWRMVVFIAGD